MEASRAPCPAPRAVLPDEFARSVEAKVAQMRRHAAARDRPSRGAPVELSVAAASRRLKRCGLRCRCGAESSLAFAHATAAFAHATAAFAASTAAFAHATAVCAHPLAAVSHFAAHPHRPPSSVTNVPLSATPGSPFAWSFDRVVAGSTYTMAGVQPVLHRYNDAKYVWPDNEARAWLRGFVAAHGGDRTRIDDRYSTAAVIDLESADTTIVLE